MTLADALRRWSDAAWRLLVIAVAALLVGALVWKLRVVVLPVLVALLLCSVLAPPVAALRRRGWPPALAATAVFVGSLLVMGGVLALVVPPTVSEVADTATSLDQGLGDVEQWLVDGPLNLDRSTVHQYTDDPQGTLVDLVRSSSGTVTRSVLLVGEVVAGAILAVVLTFLFLKDGPEIQGWLLGHVPERHRDVVAESAAAAWEALGGFLRGAALLGLVEGIIIGATVWLVGAPLALPVAVFTFLAAFFPIVGAIAAGALAVLVTLSSQGVGDALIVLVVVVLVQQFDNDLMAPLIYGRSLQLHPVVILLVLTAGGTLGGIVGAFVAVPTAGAVVGVSGVLWRRRGAEPTTAVPSGRSP